MCDADGLLPAIRSIVRLANDRGHHSTDCSCGSRSGQAAAAAAAVSIGVAGATACGRPRRAGAAAAAMLAWCADVGRRRVTPVASSPSVRPSPQLTHALVRLQIVVTFASPRRSRAYSSARVVDYCRRAPFANWFRFTRVVASSPGSHETRFHARTDAAARQDRLPLVVISRA